MVTAIQGLYMEFILFEDIFFSSLISKEYLSKCIIAANYSTLAVSKLKNAHNI